VILKIENENKFAKVFSEIRKYNMQGADRLVHLLHYLLMSEHLEGDVVEMGCHSGGTAMLFSLLTTKKVYLYDSFEGFPEKDTDGKDSLGFQPHKYAVTIDSVLQNYKKYDIIEPIIVSGYFSDLTKKDLPSKISFAHIDGDLYQSVIESLELVYPLVTSGGYILIDDYLSPRYEGSTQAVKDFFADKPEIVDNLPGSNGTQSYKALVIKE
jgi:O-methyltransferase